MSRLNVSTGHPVTGLVETPGVLWQCFYRRLQAFDLFTLLAIVHSILFISWRARTVSRW